MLFAATRIWCVFPVSGLATRRRAAGSSPGPRPIDRESQVQAGFAQSRVSRHWLRRERTISPTMTPFFFDGLEAVSPTYTLATRFAANASPMAAAARRPLARTRQPLVPSSRRWASFRSSALSTSSNIPGWSSPRR